MNDTVVSVWLMNAGGCCGGVGVDESGKWESLGGVGEWV
jgi:hypothetical protein